MIFLPNFAILGKAGAGKDELAEALMGRFDLGYQRLALADPLKDVAAGIWGDAARKDRRKLQQLGKAVRAIDVDAWVNNLQRRAVVAEPVADHHPLRIVVTDCRFANEVQAFAEAGYRTIRVHAPRALRIDRLRANGKLQDEADLDDSSETELDGYAADYTVENDGTREELAAQIGAVLNRVAR